MSVNKSRLSLVRVRPSRTLLGSEFSASSFGEFAWQDAIRGRLLCELEACRGFLVH